MKKSPVAGISGSIRIICLSRANLAAAERHGKRQDKTSQARAISADPPYTDTGLDLLEQYDEHVRDAFVPKRQYIAKHVILQFPKDLVDGEDQEFMVRHYRRIIEGIFGEDAIFGVRVDRDERGRNIVDGFIAPKYTKVTKHTAKPAVTLTKHEVALAKKHGRSNSTYGRGQAMQDEIFDYFRDVMRLRGVQRGDPKTAPGPDWLSAEQLREEEMKEERAKLDLASQQQARDAKEAEQAKTEAAADREAAKAERDAARATSEAAKETARASEAQAKSFASDAQAAADALSAAKTAADLDRDAARRERSAAEGENRRLRDEAREMHQAAASDRAEAAKDRQIARRQQSMEAAQIALLSRASDDDAGLRLRLDGDSFRMDEEKMTTSERSAYQSKWSDALVAMARNLARFLERMRDRARQLLNREREVDERVEKLEARERDLDIQSQAVAARRAVADAEAEKRLISLHSERKAYEQTKAQNARATRLIGRAHEGGLEMDEKAITLTERFHDGSHAEFKIDELPVWSQEVLRDLCHFQHQRARIENLEGMLQQRLNDAAVRYPDQAPAVGEVQREVAAEIRKVFVPSLGNGFGRG